MSKRDVEPCEVSDAACIAAAGYGNRIGYVTGEKSARCECYGCGHRVCSACSSNRQYRGALRRLCNRCQVERLDDGSEARVMRRLRALVERT